MMVCKACVEEQIENIIKTMIMKNYLKTKGKLSQKSYQLYLKLMIGIFKDKCKECPGD